MKALPKTWVLYEPLEKLYWLCQQFLSFVLQSYRAPQVPLVVKNPPVNAGDIRDVGSIPGWGRSPGGGNSNPFQYSCLENLMDRRPWGATVHRVAKSWTRLKQLSTWKKEEPLVGDRRRACMRYVPSRKFTNYMERFITPASLCQQWEVDVRSCFQLVPLPPS